jgi:dihydrolipoamide dehydrogenase
VWSKAKKGLKVSVEPAKGGDGETIEADIVLVAIGRVPYTARASAWKRPA